MGTVFSEGLHEASLSVNQVDVVNSTVANPVPEPSSIALVSIGLLSVTGFFLCRRRGGALVKVRTH